MSEGTEDITATDPDVRPSEITNDRVGLEADPDQDVVTGATDGHVSGDEDDEEDAEDEGDTTE